MSREPRDEWVPARITLRATSIGGRAVLRGLASGPAAFLLLFVLVGLSLATLGTWGRFWAPPERAEQLADPRFYLAAMAFGGVFVLVAVSLLRVVLTSQAQSRHLGSRPARQGPPWTWDHPWRPDQMGPDYDRQGGGTLGTAAVLSLIALFNIALASGPWLLKIAILVFDAFGLLLLYSWVTKVINAVRFRRPTIAWRTFPAHPGGPVEATVRFAAPLEATGPATVTLRCLRDTPDESIKNAQGSLRAVSIYRATRKVTCTAPLSSLDIALQVPPDLPGTNLGREDAVYWQVVVQVPVNGPDFDAIFLAPVYEPAPA